MVRSSKSRRTSVPLIQPLEDRRLMAAQLDIAAANAWYDGSAVANNLTISYANGVYTLTDTAEIINLHDRAKDEGATGDGTHTVTFPAAAVAALRVNTGDGSDTVNLLSSDRQININTAGGFFDTINLGDNGNLDGIQSIVDVYDTGGSASLNLDDTANTNTKDVRIVSGAIFGAIPKNGTAVSFFQGITSVSVALGSANGTGVKVEVTDSYDLQSLNVNTGNGVSGVRVGATTATMATNINTQGGTLDTVNIGDGDTSEILGPVNVNGSSDTLLLVVDDIHGDVAHNVNVNNGAVTGAAPGTVSYGTGVTNLIVWLNEYSEKSDTITFNHSGGGLKTAALNAGDGADKFFITPSSTVEVGIGGGTPVAPTINGDNLYLNLTGVTGAALDLNADKHSGTWTFNDHKKITFAGIESYDAANLKEVVKNLGLPKGHETAALAKLNLKGNAGDVAKVESFIEFVGTLLNNGEITQAQADALIVQANLLLQSL